MSDQEQLSEADAKWRAYQNAPKFRHVTRELDGKLERESYVYSTPAGSIELWRTPSQSSRMEYFGGVETHSATQLYDFAPKVSHTNCHYTPTGECWHDGSSLAFDQFEHSFNSPDFIKAELADWHQSRFGNQAEESK
jgi:hypothetical protein